MTIPKGMDELLWGKELEDVFDWAKKLHMVVEVHAYDEEKLFKIYKFNLRRKAKDWYKRLNPTPLDW
jgi:hypothetical protein